MSWRWYKQVALPEGTMTIDVQDFVDLWARHPKEFWDAAVDFPDLTLRSPRIFLVAAAPRTWHSETFGQQPWPRSSPKRWGVAFNAVPTDATWSDEQKVPLISVVGAEPDELVLRNAEAKRLARWWVKASMFEEERTPSASKAVQTAVWSYMLDEEGSIPLVGGWPWFGSWDRDVESLRLAEDRLKYLHPMLLAISAWNENAAVFCDRLRPPWFQLKLPRGRLPTIGRDPQRDLAS
jgi:hypothetical protein